MRNKWIRSKIFVLKTLGRILQQKWKYLNFRLQISWFWGQKERQTNFQRTPQLMTESSTAKSHKTSKCTWPQVPSPAYFYLSYIVWISLWFSSFCRSLYKTWTSNVMKESWKKRSGNNLSGFIQVGLSLWRKVDLDICQHFNIVSSSVTTLFNSFKSNWNVYFLISLKRLKQIFFFLDIDIKEEINHKQYLIQNNSRPIPSQNFGFV